MHLAYESRAGGGAKDGQAPCYLHGLTLTLNPRACTETEITPFAKVWRERTPSELITIRLVEPDPGNNNFLNVRDRDATRAGRYFTGQMERGFGVAATSLEWVE